MSFETGTDMCARFVGRYSEGSYSAALSPDRQEALRLAVFHKLGSPDGPFDLTARAWVAVGQVD